ncbi:Uu.00g035230.m01.CDS01 [Anthostomella pinea]|uniref:Uu.00g035230.m01.CDS01 n=1 Tax=Anthostomella pinea TaxID=933095 RepID=A0AAI8YDE8_9PEZI|nr:Uu.00g035230.m01.CDS01 [Anthostomella pinea]
MSLHYPLLNDISTVAVFELNLKRIKDRLLRRARNLRLNEVQICVFASQYWRDYPKARWNGRQVRNACQTALALAEFEAQGGNHQAVLDPGAVIDLEVKHFQTVSDAYLGFMEYLKDIYGADADERAYEQSLRAKTKDPTAPKMNPLSTRETPSVPSGNTPANFQGPTQMFQKPSGKGMGGVPSFNPAYYGQPMGPGYQPNHGFAPSQPMGSTPQMIPPGQGQVWQNMSSRAAYHAIPGSQHPNMPNPNLMAPQGQGWQQMGQGPAGQQYPGHMNEFGVQSHPGHSQPSTAHHEQDPRNVSQQDGAPKLWRSKGQDRARGACLPRPPAGTQLLERVDGEDERTQPRLEHHACVDKASGRGCGRNPESMIRG